MNDYRIYKGYEYYGRNIEFLDKLVLVCTRCVDSYVGTYSSEKEVDIAKKIHNVIYHNKIEIN